MEENPVIPTQDELTTLKARADKIGVSYHPSIGVDKLREKVNKVLESDTGSNEAEPAADSEADAAAEPKETDAKRKARKRKQAAELVRIRVTCMNPNKKEHDGEIFTAGNSLVGTYRKYVPFNADEGWHVPRIIYNQLVQRQCQVFTTVRDRRGNASRKGKLIKEFSIEVLDPLTEAELQELAQRQAMSKSVE